MFVSLYYFGKHSSSYVAAETYTVTTASYHKVVRILLVTASPNNLVIEILHHLPS